MIVLSSATTGRPAAPAAPPRGGRGTGLRIVLSSAAAGRPAAIAASTSGCRCTWLSRSGRDEVMPMSTTLDHVTIVAEDFEASRAVYDALLGCLGLAPTVDFSDPEGDSDDPGPVAAGG